MGRESEMELARRHIEAFERQMRACTARLSQIENGQPRSGGSGLLYAHWDRHFVLSVLHNFDPADTGWVLETDCKVGEHPLCIILPPINWLNLTRLGSHGELEPGIDGLAWVELDLNSLGRKLRGDVRFTGRTLSLVAYQGSLETPPTDGELYGFVASPPREFHEFSNTLCREPIIEIGMTYVGTDARGFYCFKLGHGHPGDRNYKGSSGAPIADREGTVVALVQGGDPEGDIIFGVPLATYGRALELQFQQTAP